MASETESWTGGLPLRKKGAQFSVTNRDGTTVKVEVNNLSPTMEINGPSITHVELTGFVGDDRSIGIDSKKANFFEGNKGEAGLTREPTSDSLLGILQARLAERLATVVRIAIPEESMGTNGLGFERGNGVYKYVASIDVPKTMDATQVQAAVRQELREIQSILTPDAPFQRGLGGAGGAENN